MKFEDCNPLINFIYFVAMMYFSIAFNHPIYMAIACVAGSLYLVVLYGKRSIKMFGIFFLFVTIFTIYYAAFNHFGVTSLWRNKIGNSITFESVCYGLVLAVRMVIFVIYFLCFVRVIKSDKIIYLLGRLFPKLSLFVSIFLRSLGRLKTMSENVNMGRSGIGQGKGRGRFLTGISNKMKMFKAVVTWFTESFFEAADSMRCRGYTLKKRTSFSIYHFGGRDRVLLLWLSFGIITAFMADTLRLTKLVYNPYIQVEVILPYDYIYYIIYGLFSLTPLILKTKGSLMQDI